MKLRLLCAFIMFSSGCTIVTDQQQQDQLNASWMGKTISEYIISKKVPPEKRIDLPDGVIVYVWTKDEISKSDVVCKQGPSNAVQCSGGEVKTERCDESVFVDQNGIIKQFSLNGCEDIRFD